MSDCLVDAQRKHIADLERQLAAQVELADNALFSARDFERENGKLRQSNVSLDQQLKDSEGRCKSRDKVIYSLEQQLALSESLCVALDVKYNSAALGIVQLDQQLEDLREVFKGMRHIDCRGTGGYHSIEHDEWLAALNNDKDRVGE